jgi:tight adherence protein B
VLAVGLSVAAVIVAAIGVAPAMASPARLPGTSATAARWLRCARWPVARMRRPVAPDEVTVAAWCDRVAGEVRAGSSLSHAVVAASQEPGAPFEHVAHAIRRGRPLAAVFRDDRTDPTTPVGLAAPVMAMCAEVGGPAALALERLAATLLARAAERDERRTASAQARLSARVLTLLPLCVVTLLVLVEPSIRAAIATPAGAACVLVGATLDLVGAWWMSRMIGAVS